MAVTGTGSVSSALGITGKGIGGLATGLNTDELVEALTSGTRAKIAKQGQQKQLLNWKMTAYRSMATALTAFQSKFLKISTSSSSNTNITSSKFFNTYKATSSSSAVSASATSGATSGGFTIDNVSQLATSESYTSTKQMSTALNLNIKDEDIKEGMFTGQTLKLEVDGFSTKTIKLDDLNKYVTKTGTPTTTTVIDDETGEETEVTTDGPPYTYSLDEDFKEGLQKLLNETYKSSTVIKVGGEGTDLTLDSGSARITVNASNTLLDLVAGESNRVSTDMKIGDLDAFKNVQGDVLTFSINGVEISVNKRDSIDTLLSAVTNSGANVRMDYDQYNDVFTLTSKNTGADSSFEMNDIQGNLMSEIFGAKGGTGIGTDNLITSDEITIGEDFVSKIAKMSKAEKKSYASTLSNMNFQITINGETRNVKLDTTLGLTATQLSNGTYTAEDIYKAINKGIESAFSSTGVTFGSDDDGKTVVSTSRGESFTLKASGDFAKMLGINGDGSAVTTGNSVLDLGYSSTISSSAAGDGFTTDTGTGYLNAEALNITSENPASFEMTINGTTKTVTVTPAKDKNGNDVKVTNENFVDRLNAAIEKAFGDDAADVSFRAVAYETVGGYFPSIDVTAFDDQPDGYYLDGKKLYDKGDEPGYYKDGVRVYDEEGIALDENGEKIANIFKTSGVKLSLNIASDYLGTVETSVSINGAFAEAIGFADGSHNSAATSNTVKLTDLKNCADIGEGQFSVNGKTVSYDSTTDLNSFLFDLNEALGDKGAAGIKDGKLFITSEDGDLTVTDSGTLLENLFGIKGGEYKTAAENYTSTFKFEDELDEDGNVIGQVAASSHTKAVNAQLSIDGRVLENSSNTITYNGVSLTLNDLSTEKIQIGVQYDPDDVVTRIQEWMDDYNSLVFTLNSAINESKNLDYSPLTDEQREGMTEDQIKTWETEAKKGLLRNDQTLKQILSDMRNALYERVEAAGISLYDIGIVTKSGLSDMNQAGQLEFDQNVTGGGEARLREMLTSDPDKVRTLFAGTGSEDGIGAKLNAIIQRAASDSSVDRGTLVRIAGTEKLTGDNTSQLGNKVTALDKYIAALKTRLESEYNRYWKQFTALETSVQKMNTQSSWLTQQ